MTTTQPTPPASPRIVFATDWLPVVHYTRSSRFRGEDKDPINLAYAGDVANLEAIRDLTQLLGLRSDIGVGSQQFFEPAPQRVGHAQDVNLATSPVGATGRLHTRIYELFSDHAVFGRVIASPVHEESWARCGFWVSDAVIERGFDSARELMVSSLQRRGLEATYISLPGYAPIVQCNGRSVDSDGLCAVVSTKGQAELFQARLMSAGAEREILTW